MRSEGMDIPPGTIWQMQASFPSWPQHPASGALPGGGIIPPAHLESCIARRPSQRAGADKRSDMNHRVHLYEAKLMDG